MTVRVGRTCNEGTCYVLLRKLQLIYVPYDCLMVTQINTPYTSRDRERIDAYYYGNDSS